MNKQLSNADSWSVVPMLVRPGCRSSWPAARRSPITRALPRPDDAVSALIDAARKVDARDCASCSDPARTRSCRPATRSPTSPRARDFIAKYDEKHALAPEGDDSVRLQVGTDDWPLPVPVVRRDGEWYLDGAEGADEIVYRRIGRNELGAIAVCRGYVDAQHEYAAADHDGEGAGIYAHKLVSDPGTQNGLYWESVEGEPESPVGPFIAAAAAEGYRAGGGAYHGYRYRPLFRQTDNANGGALEYFDKGVLRNGFALRRLAGRVRRERRHDLHRQPGRRRVPEGSRRRHRGRSRDDRRLRPRLQLGRRHRKRLKTFTFGGICDKGERPLQVPAKNCTKTIAPFGWAPP